jgi:hypothetical protein
MVLAFPAYESPEYVTHRVKSPHKFAVPQMHRRAQLKVAHHFVMHHGFSVA